jgi:hypothetical protein
MEQPAAPATNTGPGTQAMNTGPRPVTMDDIYKLVGALHLEIEVLRRQNAELQAQLAATHRDE